MDLSNNKITSSWRDINGLILDCDGVLTDGSILVDDNGLHYRRFNMRDGLGLVHLRNAGVQIGIVSSATHKSIIHRAKCLGITDVCTGADDKTVEVMRLSQQWGIATANIAYLGDDLLDLPAMRLVGFPIALSDAMPMVLAEACYIASKGGGKGGVREICDLIILSKHHTL